MFALQDTRDRENATAAGLEATTPTLTANDNPSATSVSDQPCLRTSPAKMPIDIEFEQTLFQHAEVILSQCQHYLKFKLITNIQQPFRFKVTFAFRVPKL